MNKRIGKQVDKVSNSKANSKSKGSSNKKLPQQELNENDAKNISIKQKPTDIENQKSNADFRTNLTSEQTNLLKIDFDLEKSNKNKGGRNKLVDTLCVGCGITDKTKLIHCYLCKKIKCKPCAEKEYQYSSKKRDQSNYICENCFNKDSFKIRNKQAAADFSKIRHNDINYTSDLNNINIKNSKNMKRKTLISKNEELEKNKEEILKEEKEDLLNLDLLYDCVSPPSELDRNTRIKAKTNLAPSLTNRKRRRVKNLNNPNFDLVCHQCQKINPKVEYFKCVKAECGKFYCNKCIRRYSSLGNSKHINRTAKVLDYCYSCRRICKCEKCQKEYISMKNNNFVQVDLENLGSNKNLVKIDDYVILENAEVDDYSEEQEEHSDLFKESEFIADAKKNNIDKEIKDIKTPSHYVPTIEEERTRMCIDAVESSRNSYKSGKVLRCIRCVNHNPSHEGNKENTLNFKSLEEFIVYLNYFFSKDQIKGDKDYAESHTEYNDYVSNYFKKYYSDSDYVFKSIKIICKDCFNACLKAKNGFYNLFSYLHIGQNHANIKPKCEENSLKNSAVIKINEKMEIVENNQDKLMQIKISLCTSNNLIPENLSKIPINISSALHGDETNFNNELNSNNSRKENVAINTSLFNLYKSNQIPSAIFNPNQNTGQVNSNNSNANVNKILEMFSNIRPNSNGSNNQYNNSLLRNFMGNTTNNNNNNFNLGNINNINSLQGNDFKQSVPNFQNQQNFEQNMGSINKNLNNTNNTTNIAENSNLINDCSNDKKSLMNLLTSLNPDSLNVNEIIMNIDNNTKSPGSCTGSVLEELKKQFFSIQYYSLLQKLFISYIFKNLELFIEQISKNQSLGEMIVNNIVSVIPKSSSMYQESNAKELQLLVQNINEQIALLKNINHYGINLTNALSSNFEDLKSNGIKIFKAMDPSLQQSIVSNLNSIVNSMPENNQANMGNGNNVYLPGSDLLSKSGNNVNNISNSSFGNNNGLNLQNDYLLQNFNIMMNNLSTNRNSNQGNNLGNNQGNNQGNTQANNQGNNGSLNGFNVMSGLNKFPKPVPNSNNSFDNIYNFNNLTCLNNLNSLNNIIPANTPSNNSLNKPVNNCSNIPQANTGNSINLTPQIISELLSQSNASQNSSGNINALNLMNVLASLNKGMMNTNNFNQSTSSSNTNINNNPFFSFMSPGLNNNLMMSMMGMNPLQMNQYAQMNQLNPMNQLGKSLIEKMSNYYTMNQGETTNKSNLNQNEQSINNLQVVPTEKNSASDERNLKVETEINNIDGKNSLANIASIDNDIEIENVDMNSNNACVDHNNAISK